MNPDNVQDALVRNRSVALFLVAAAILALVSDGFATAPNLQNLATAVSIEGIMVVGMALVMIGGGFDLSIGSVMALAGVLVMDLQPYGIGPAVAAALAASLVVGAVNGSLVAIVRINPFIATLATMITVRGFVMAYTNAQPVVGMELDFILLGRGKLLGVPYPTLIFAAALVVGFCALTFFPFGRHVYAIGGDEVAARQAGISVPATKMATYMASGLCAGIAGVILAARAQHRIADHRGQHGVERHRGGAAGRNQPVGWDWNRPGRLRRHHVDRTARQRDESLRRTGVLSAHHPGRAPGSPGRAGHLVDPQGAHCVGAACGHRTLR